MNEGGIAQTGDVPLDYLYPYCGFGFLMLSIYLETPHFLGCSSRTYFCCSNWEQLTCKVARHPNSTNACCVTNMTKCECVWPPVFVKVSYIVQHDTCMIRVYYVYTV